MSCIKDARAIGMQEIGEVKGVVYWLVTSVVTLFIAGTLVLGVMVYLRPI